MTEIRLARPEEYDRAGTLTVEAYRVDGFVSDTSHYAAVLADAAVRAKTATLLVAVAGPDVLGTVTYCPPGSQLRQIARPDEAEFRMLAVAHAGRGRGIGEALVRCVLVRASEAGLAAVVLLSGSKMVAAHRLYRRLGFVPIPERDMSPEPGVDLRAWRVAL